MSEAAKRIADLIPELTHLELYTLRNLMFSQEMKLEALAKDEIVRLYATPKE